MLGDLIPDAGDASASNGAGGEGSQNGGRGDDDADDDSNGRDDDVNGADDDANGADDDANGDDTGADDDGSRGDDDGSRGDDDATGRGGAGAMDDDAPNGGTASGGGSSMGGDGAGGALSSIPCSADSDCDNGLFCDGDETCQGGFCAAGEPFVCDDGVACTADHCSESGRTCDYIPRDSACSDGAFCNGVERCDVIEGCQPGDPPSCSDGVDCTADSCDEANDRCAFEPNDSLCSDDLFCNGQEVCDPGAGCIAGKAPSCDDSIGCTVDSCDEAAGGCVNEPNDLACSNGVFCDGAEVCTPGLGCEAGVAVTCESDGIDCTVDACDEATQACAATPSSALCAAGQFCTAEVGCEQGEACTTHAECDDGNPCNGVEQCQPDASMPEQSFCVPGTPVDCDDGIDCTLDSCDLGSGQCQHAAQNGLCSDSDVCNGSEVCDLALGCQPGTALDCDDGVDCTDDATCIPESGCVNSPLDELCQDGSVCNGTETCDAVLGCLPGTPLVCGSDGVDCTVDVCDDAKGGCVHEPDDSLCGNGTCTPGATVSTCDPTLGCGNFCSPATCQGKTYLCGDCKDNDGDCKADDRDSACIGACSNNEEGYKGEIPGQNSNACDKMDCYFDQDSGAGNDKCAWAHACDPLEPTPSCDYDANTHIPGTSLSCSQLQAGQSTACTNFCEPLAPNGCDCFGCCQIASGGTTYTVYLGSEDAQGNGTCNPEVADDPSKCHPCTQVPGCMNPCDECEICLGKDTLPPQCNGEQFCPDTDPCGQPGQAECPDNMFCLTGCCTGF